MAAGEYVSVHSQADSEEAELALEGTELKTDNRGEHKELTAIYVARGLDPALAKQVAEPRCTHSPAAKRASATSLAFSIRCDASLTTNRSHPEQ